MYKGLLRQYELELELKNSVKPEKKEATKCILCSKKNYNKEKIEVHYWKVHRDSFKWIACKLSCGRFPCGKVREEEFKDHIRRHDGAGKVGGFVQYRTS